MADQGDETVDRITAFVRMRFPTAGDHELTPELSLLDSGIVDSLGVLDLVGFLEQEFEVSLEDDDLVPENFDSIAALASFVATRR